MITKFKKSIIRRHSLRIPKKKIKDNNLFQKSNGFRVIHRGKVIKREGIQQRNKMSSSFFYELGAIIIIIVKKNTKYEINPILITFPCKVYSSGEFPLKSSLFKYLINFTIKICKRLITSIFFWLV